MANLQCPRCRRLSVPLSTKMVAPPGGTFQCSACRGKIGVPLTSAWVILPALVGTLAAVATDFSFGGIIAGMIGIGATAFLGYRYAPLVPM